MNAKPTAEPKDVAPAAAERKPKLAAKPSPTRSFNKMLSNTGQDARRKAAAILEVLAGARKPSDAAQALGITPMRYYLLELRAIQGLVKACEPVKLGPKVSPDREVQRLRKQVLVLERECARYAALARVAQRAVNLSPPPAPTKMAAGQKRRRRKPPVRAIKVLERVQSSLQESPAAGAQMMQAAPTP